MKAISTHLNIQWKTVIIIGNRAYRNMWDELILLWTVKLLLRDGKNIIISCLDPLWLKHFFKQFLTEKEILSITFIHELPKGFRSFFRWIKKGWIRELKYFWTTDSVILGGWEIFTAENPSAYRGYRALWMRPFLFKKILWDFLGNSTKFLYLMWGIQVPDSKVQQIHLNFWLKNSDHLYLRDFQTIEEVENFINSHSEWNEESLSKKIDFCMDTSYFAYPWNEVLITEGREVSPEKYIVVNICDQNFVSDVANDIKPYLDQGYKIYYIPVYRSHKGIPSDLHFKHILEEKLNAKHPFEILDWIDDFQRFVSVLKGAETVFCTRLHLFLVASYLQVTTKVYPYQRKIIKMQKVLENVLIKK